MLKMFHPARIVLFGTVCLAAAGGGQIRGAASPTSINEGLFSGLTWRCIGPFDGGPVSSVVGEAGVPGVYVITTPSGGSWKTVDGGDTWTSFVRVGVVETLFGDSHRWVDSFNPRRIARTDAKGIEVSLDAGATWLQSHNLPIAEVAHLAPRTRQPEPPGRRAVEGRTANVVVADPVRPGLLFAGTGDSVFVSFDSGEHWQSLRLNMPQVAINDLDIRGNDLVVATQGRSMWQLDDISPLRQITASNASAAAILFKPADPMIEPRSDRTDPRGFSPAVIDYYATRGDVTLEIFNAAGRVVYALSSATPDLTDRWLPVMKPLSTSPGHHRIVWNLHMTPPPAQKHSYAQLARAAFEELPPDPDGPPVLAGTYRVKLTVAGRSYTQPLVVRPDPKSTPATLAAARREYDLALKVYDAMDVAHRAFMQMARVRAQLAPMLTSTDDDVLATATALEAQLVQLDGSDWTGLIIPDEDQEDFDPNEAEEQGIKHPDFIPPKPVSVSKDYDDPTSILGRRFEALNHAPAFATISADLGSMLTKVMRTPDVVAGADYDRTCRQLSGVLDAWRTVNAQELARVNAEFARKKLRPLPIAPTVPAMVCR